MVLHTVALYVTETCTSGVQPAREGETTSEMLKTRQPPPPFNIVRQTDHGPLPYHARPDLVGGKGVGHLVSLPSSPQTIPDLWGGG